MANWKKVIVSGSIAELSEVTASVGLNLPVLGIGTAENYILTVGASGSVEKRDPKTIGAAFQSMSIADSPDLGDFGTSTFIAEPGLNELVFVSGSNIQLATSQSYDVDSNESVGYIKISALTSSVLAKKHETTITQSGNVFTVGTVQAISTGSNVTFGTISSSVLTVTTTDNLVASFKSSDDLASIKLEDDNTVGYISTKDNKLSIGKNSGNNATNLHIDVGSGTTVGNLGIGNKYPGQKLTVEGHISASGGVTASGNLHMGGDGRFGGNLSVDGGSIFGLNGFGITIDDVSVLSGSTNFGSGSLPSAVTHHFTGSLSVTGSGITLTGGTFAGDGNSLTNLDMDNVTNVHNLTWGTTLTASAGDGTVYNPTSSITLNLNISGSSITSSKDGIYIPGRSIRIDQITSSADEGDLLTWSGSNKVPSVIKIGSDGHVLTSNGPNATASFQALPPTLALGIETGSYSLDAANGVGLILTSSLGEIVTNIAFSGSANQISISGSNQDNTFHLRLADTVSGIASFTATNITASSVRVTGDISASGDLVVGGNFTVGGTTTLIHTTNLLVEDAFLILSSGSTANDGGFIVQDTTTGGKGFGWNQATKRWGLQWALEQDATDIVPDQYIVSAFLTGSSPLGAGEGHPTPTYGETGYGGGNMWIDTGSSNIWIYV